MFELAETILDGFDRVSADYINVVSKAAGVR